MKQQSWKQWVSIFHIIMMVGDECDGDGDDIMVASMVVHGHLVPGKTRTHCGGNIVSYDVARSWQNAATFLRAARTQEMFLKFSETLFVSTTNVAVRSKQVNILEAWSRQQCYSHWQCVLVLPAPKDQQCFVTILTSPRMRLKWRTPSLLLTNLWLHNVEWQLGPTPHRLFHGKIYVPLYMAGRQIKHFHTVNTGQASQL